jgi:hemolysin D
VTMLETAPAPKLSENGAPTPRPVFDYDFPSVLSMPPKHRLILWLMAAMMVSVVAWLWFARVDIIVTAAGKIISSKSQIVIQPLETSVVRSVAVKPGDKVKAGAVLATLDPTFTQADEADLGAQLAHLQATSERIATEIAGLRYQPVAPTPEQVIEQRIFEQRLAEHAAKQSVSDRKIGGYQADLAAHEAEAKGLNDEIALVDEQEQIYRKLAQQTLTSRLELLDAQQRLVEAKSRLGTNRGEQKQLEEQIAQETSDWEAYNQEWERKLSEQQAKTVSERNAIEARLSKAKLRSELSVLRAPTDAIVLDVADRPAGSVMREAEALMRLVAADGALLSEVEINPRDVGRIQVGDPVTLKLEALPWQQFGLAHGIVRSISPDVLTDDGAQQSIPASSQVQVAAEQRTAEVHYRVRIDLTDTSFRNPPEGFELRPGMRLNADIKVGRRSVLEYLLNPITRVLDESLREP